MSCREFERWLEPWSTGELSDEIRELCDRHLSGCPDCSELAELARLPDGPELPEGLVAAVLGGTGADACRSALDRRVAELDGELGGVDAELLALHQSSCSRCAGLGSVLAALDADLPTFAEVEPDAAFVGDVLVATLPGTVRWRRWWSARWQQWARRPRFALEVAYAGALTMLLLFGNPNSALAALPLQVLDMTHSAARAHRERALPLLGDQIEQATTRMEQRAPVVGASGSVATQAAAQTGRVWTRAHTEVGNLWTHAASLLTNDATPEPAPVHEDNDEERR